MCPSPRWEVGSILPKPPRVVHHPHDTEKHLLGMGMDAGQTKRQIPTIGQCCYPYFLVEGPEVLELRNLPKSHKTQEGTDSNQGVSESRTHPVSIQLSQFLILNEASLSLFIWYSNPSNKCSHSTHLIPTFVIQNLTYPEKSLLPSFIPVRNLCSFKYSHLKLPFSPKLKALCFPKLQVLSTKTKILHWFEITPTRHSIFPMGLNC